MSQCHNKDIRTVRKTSYFAFISQKICIFATRNERMKKRGILYIICAALTIIAVLSSCEFETSGNGDLDGLWQLSVRDSLVTGTSYDVHMQGEYWAVQVHLLQIRGGRHSGYYRFRYADGRLKLYPPQLDADGRQDTTTLFDYRVVNLNGSRLVLQDDTVRLSFRKY